MNIKDYYTPNEYLDDYSSKLVGILNENISKFIKEVYEPISSFVLIYKICALGIILIKSISLYFDYKSKIIKYLIHLLWFFSGLFTIFVLFILTFFFIFGNITLTMGQSIEPILTNSSEISWPNIKLCLIENKYSNYYLKDDQYKSIISFSAELKDLNQTAQNKKIIDALNDISMSMFENYVYSTVNPFGRNHLLKEMKTLIVNYTNPYNSLLDNNKVSIIMKTNNLLNELLNNRGKFPMQNYLNCENSLNIEMYFDKSLCKYLLNEGSDFADNSCYLIQNFDRNMLVDNLNILYSKDNCDCSRFIKESNFCEKTQIKELILFIFDDLRQFYDSFQKSTDLISNGIIFE